MNKYTLTFSDMRLETNYQNQKIEQLRKPVYIFSAIGLFFISLTKLITEVLDNQLDHVAIIIVTQVYLVISLMLIRWKPQFCQTYLIILNYILLAYQFMLTSTITQEALQLFANNFVACNLIIILVIDMIQAIFVLASTFTLRLVFTMLWSSEPQYNVYFATLLLIFFLSFCLRKINYESRSFFLLSLKDNLMEQILPTIVNKSYLLVQFDTCKLSFSLISSKKLDFDCETSEQMKKFLRDWHYKSQNLEKFFFTEIQNQQSTEGIKSYSQQIQIYKNHQEKLVITFCMFNYQSPTLLIKFENDTKNQEKVKNYLSKIISQEKLIQFKLFKSITKQVEVALKQTNLCQIYLLRIQCYKQILNYKILNNQFKSQKFDVESVLMRLKEFFSFINISYQLISPQGSKLFLLRTYFTRLLLEVFFQSKKNTVVVVNTEFSAQPYIRYVGREIQPENDAVLSTVFSTLVKRQQKVTMNKTNNILLLLNEEPNQTFLQYVQN